MNRINSNRGSATLNGISKGEKSIRQTLVKLGVKYYRESKFSDCRGGSADKPLPFDFSVYVQGELVALIEYQGVQHSVPTFGMEDYMKVRATDDIKRAYCSEKGIPLLEVPFNKFKDIDTIVTKFLREKGILKRTRQSRQLQFA